MSDGVHIQPDIVDGVAGTVLAKGTGMKSGWDLAKKAIESAETGIGHSADKLVTAFQIGAGTGGGYGILAQHAQAAAEQLPTKFIDHGNTGKASAEQYREADRQAAGHFPR